MPETFSVAGILLAAGQSSRMGAFKPLLPFGETTVVEHCVKNLREADIKTIVVVVGNRAAELTAHLAESGVTFAHNPDPTSEMAASITAGVRELPGSIAAFVVMPVDHPAVTADVISSLVREWRSGSPVVVPTYNKRGGHPVIIDSGFRQELLDLDQRQGLRGFLQEHADQVKRLPVSSAYVARDMDTWDDYLALHQDFFGFAPK